MPTKQTKYAAIVRVEKDSWHWTVSLRSNDQVLGSFSADTGGSYDVYRPVSGGVRESHYPIQCSDLGLPARGLRYKASSRSEAIEAIVEYHIRRSLAAMPIPT